VTLSELSLRRPVLAIVLNLILLLLGFVSLSFLGVREYPAVDPPVVTVRTSYPGASPQTIDSTITEPLEQSVYGVAGIRTVSSTSREGASEIRVEFDLSVDLEAAANDIRDKVSTARRQLPPDVDMPVVEKADADSEPIVFLTVRSETKDILEISHVADVFIKERLQTIPGVATVRIFGEKRYAMRLHLDADAMTAHGVTPQDVRAALQRENVELPAGRLEAATTEVGLRLDGRLAEREDFEGMVIRRDGERTVRLRDIGRASLEAENTRTGLKREGLPMIGVAVVPQPNTNAVAIADEFYKRLEEIKRDLPPEYMVDIGYDFTRYVRRSIAEVEESLWVAFGLVALIIFAFLRDWRATLVPVLAIPVSIVSAFLIMYAAGFSVNTLTLVALVLAIGLVCDDAIVVLEAIYARVERGMSPLQAAQEGSREIFFAVIATTAALVVVFLPVIFLEGLTGQLFKEFGVVLSGSVIVSSFVALTLSPVLSRFLLKAKRPPTQAAQDGAPDGAQDGAQVYPWSARLYRWALRLTVRTRWLVMPILVFTLAGIFKLYSGLPQELSPLEDRSNIRVSVLAPEGVSFEYMESAMAEVAEWVEDNVPEVAKTFTILARGGGAVNSGIQNIYLVEGEDRSRSQKEIAQDIGASLSRLDRVRVFPSQPPTIGSRFSGQPISYVLQATSVERLVEVLPGFLEAAQRRPELGFLDANLKLTRTEDRVFVDRDRAAALGVSPQDVGAALQLGFSDQRLGYFMRHGRQYQVMGLLERGQRNEPQDVSALLVRSQSGEVLPLSQVVRWDESAAPSAIYRFDRQVSATISGSPAASYTLGDAIGALDEVAKDLPQDVGTALSGEARELRESTSSLLWSFVLALLLAYLVLAAQFESFIDPLVILLSVPLALVGALYALQWAGMTLNIFSQIGLIMLIGLVTKNAILIVEFANQRKEQGLSVREAVIDAATQRLRPILMTTLSTVLGVLPIALSLGASAGSRQALGVAVIGGILIGTVLSLFVVPALYTYLSRERVQVES
jgi:multidrug efflux pump